MKLKDLAVDHPYYCSDSNYFSNEASKTYYTWPEFYGEMKGADPEYNLIFRWEIREHEDDDGVKSGAYYMEIFYMQQRKGLYMPISIKRVFEEDVPQIIEFLQAKYTYLKKLWEPIQ